MSSTVSTTTHSASTTTTTPSASKKGRWLKPALFWMMGICAACALIATIIHYWPSSKEDKDSAPGITSPREMGTSSSSGSGVEDAPIILPFGETVIEVDPVKWTRWIKLPEHVRFDAHGTGVGNIEYLFPDGKKIVVGKDETHPLVDIPPVFKIRGTTRLFFFTVFKP